MSLVKCAGSHIKFIKDCHCSFVPFCLPLSVRTHLLFGAWRTWGNPVHAWRFWSLGGRYRGDPLPYPDLLPVKECWREQLGDRLEMVRDKYYEFLVSEVKMLSSTGLHFCAKGLCVGSFQASHWQCQGRNLFPISFVYPQGLAWFLQFVALRPLHPTWSFSPAEGGLWISTWPSVRIGTAKQWGHTSQPSVVAQHSWSWIILPSGSFIGFLLFFLLKKISSEGCYHQDLQFKVHVLIVGRFVHQDTELLWPEIFLGK